MVRFFLGLIMVVSLAACSVDGRKDLDAPVVPLGQFNLGHNIVIADKVVKGPLSRDVSQEVLTDALKSAIGDRFDRYDGDSLFHFGVSVEGYVLAAPGIPLVYSPKSVMIINVTVWDDAKGIKLNEEPKQLTIFESLSGETVVSSGLTQSKEKQLVNLTVNAAKQIELFLVKQQKENKWFGEDVVVSVPPLDADALIETDAPQTLPETQTNSDVGDAVNNANEALENVTVAQDA